MPQHKKIDPNAYTGALQDIARAVRKLQDDAEPVDVAELAPADEGEGNENQGPAAVE